MHARHAVPRGQDLRLQHLPLIAITTVAPSSGRSEALRGARDLPVACVVADVMDTEGNVFTLGQA